jgi:Fur family zinc uptake transcriptional regulator
LIGSKQVRRVESISAYIACKHADHDDSIVLAICDDCGCVEEVLERGALSSLKKQTNRVGFHIEASVIEVKGRCGACFSGTPA